MKYKLKAYSILEYGQRKDSAGNPHQEDCTFPLPADLNDSDRTFILCDGMGGHDAGEVASATVCEAMGRSILADGHDADGIFTDKDLARAIAAAFDALDAKDNGAEKKMGTTMTLLKLHRDGATVAHMGDSRVYHIRPGATGQDTRILFQTCDHSLVNDLIKVGELTEEEARTSRQKNVITRAMQPNMDRRPKADVEHITDIRPGDYFYMCSDGMLEQDDMASGESLRNIFSNVIKSDADKVSILTDVTQNNRDNHTALIIHILEVEGASAAQKTEAAPAVPSIGMALVDDDAAPQQEATATAPESPQPPTTAGANPRPPKPASKKLILCGLIAAIIAACCAAGYICYAAYHEKDSKETASEPQRKEQKAKPRKRAAESRQKQTKPEEAAPAADNQSEAEPQAAPATQQPEQAQTPAIDLSRLQHKEESSEAPAPETATPKPDDDGSSANTVLENLQEKLNIRQSSPNTESK